MPIGAGSRVGPYEVTALLGAGGMGEVWRARHLALGRDDALKILPAAFATDPDRLARFQREAEVLASLNHPNVAHVHGLEEIGGSRALVMELVEGPTLAERLTHGSMPIDEALVIAKQIAQGVEAAHERGIVHRDLKPANIKVRPDGTVKVLDFGLARTVDGEPPVAPEAPTVTSPAPMTKAGVVVGTTAYMSPEQARGDRVDTRVDVWAFGCVLYEMLTGKRAFEGATAPDVLAAILGGAPDLSRLPPGVPSAVRVLLRRCLARDVRQRIKSMNAVVLVLEEQDGLSAGPSSAVMPGARARRAARIVTGVVTIAAALAIGMWLARLTAPPPRIVRATIPADMYVAGTDRSFAFTPDGDRVVYISRDTSQILVHRMDGLEPISILKTASYLRGAFPSPDGQWLAFVENGFTLRKVSLAGGPATTILQMDGPSRGAAWGPDGTIVFATAASDTGLQQVAANGGPVTVLTRPDRARGEADHLQPVWLPGGRGLLFTIRPVNGDLNDSSVAVLDLQTQTWQTVVERGHAARYVGSGHLVYATTGALFAIPFDLSQRKTRGAPVEVLRPVVVNASGAVAQFDVAADGTLAYPRDGRIEYDDLVPVWVDRDGREMPIAAPPGSYRHPRISPDGRRLAIVDSGDIVVWEIDRPWSATSRITFTPGIDWFPVWTPGGERIVFGSWRGGGFSNLYIQEPGRADAERLTESPDMQLPTSISPDGSTLIFHSFTKRLEALRLDGRGTSRQSTLIETPQEERNAALSPDGRWLAYEGESPTRPGQLDIYVRPFPDVQRGLWQVSSGGGMYPAWGTRPQELFYLKTDGTFVAVPVEATQSTWRHGSPAELFRGSLIQGDGSLGRQYDVAPGGRRFVMLKSVRKTEADPHFVIVQNWLEELKRLARRDPR